MLHRCDHIFPTLEAHRVTLPVDQRRGTRRKRDQNAQKNVSLLPNTHGTHDPRQIAATLGHRHTHTTSSRFPSATNCLATPVSSQMCSSFGQLTLSSQLHAHAQTSRSVNRSRKMRPATQSSHNANAASKQRPHLRREARKFAKACRATKRPPTECKSTPQKKENKSQQTRSPQREHRKGKSRPSALRHRITHLRDVARLSDGLDDQLRPLQWSQPLAQRMCSGALSHFDTALELHCSQMQQPWSGLTKFFQ